MPQDREDDPLRFTVVVNHEGQYSIWFADDPPPPGWRAAGIVGSKAECLAYVESIWTDMRPLSLRQASGGDGPPPPSGTPA